MTAVTDGEVLYELVGAVAHVGLNRPERLNALTPRSLALLLESIERAAGDGARAILLYGVGRCFCAGADLAMAGDRDAGRKLADDYHPVARALQRSPVPIVAAVQGVTAGGGAGLALAADIVVMERTAAFAFVFATLGLVPDVGAAWLLAQSIGRARTLDLMLSGGRMTAEAAMAAGLVTRTAEPGDGKAVAESLANTLAAMPTVALGLIRAQVAAALTSPLDQALAVEIDYQTKAGRTADFREALFAFREKRPAVFCGI